MAVLRVRFTVLLGKWIFKRTVSASGPMMCAKTLVRKNIPGKLFLTLVKLVRVARVIKN